MLRRTMLAGLASLTVLGACSSGGSGGRAPIGPGQRDVVDTLARDPEFSSFAQMIKAADYADRLKRRGPITVFAPTEDAFADLRPGLRGRLLAREGRDSLRALINRHVVAGLVSRDQMVRERSLRTVDGAEVAITRQSEFLRFGTGNLVRLNINASNGLIHAIDQLQIPPGLFQGPGSLLGT